MLRLRISFAALRDLEGIANYTEEHWGRDQRDRYLLDIEKQIAELQRQPLLAASRSDLRGGYRVSRIGSHAIYFRTTADRMDVVRVLHIRMDPSRHLPDA